MTTIQSENPIRMKRDQKIYFRDTGIYIQSSADGKLTISSDGSGADDIILSGNVTFNNDVVIGGNFTFGDAIIDTLIVKGRIATSTVAGAALDLGATYTYNQLLELRADVSDWTGMADNFTGAYLRFSTSTKTTSYNLRGMELNVASTAAVVNLSGLYSETQCKALAAGSTWTSVRGIEANLSLYDQTQTVAVTEAGCIYGTIGLGSGYTAYTGLHGLVIETRDGSVGTRTLGSGIILRNISPAEGTQTFTKGLQIAMACTTGISLEGAMTTGIAVGTSGAKLSLSAAANRMIAAYSTSALTSGNSSTMTVSQTMTGASGTNSAEVGQFILTSNVQTGTYVNAVLGKIDFSTNGYSQGLAGVICGEIDLPNSAVPGGIGTYSVFEAEINCPTSCNMNSAPIAVMYISAWGTGVAEFDSNGYLFDIEGVTANTGKFIEVGTGMGTVTGTIRARLNGAAIYIPYYSAAG